MEIVNQRVLRQSPRPAPTEMEFNIKINAPGKSVLNPLEVPFIFFCFFEPDDPIILIPNNHSANPPKGYYAEDNPLKTQFPHSPISPKNRLFPRF